MNFCASRCRVAPVTGVDDVATFVEPHTVLEDARLLKLHRTNGAVGDRVVSMERRRSAGCSCGDSRSDHFATASGEAASARSNRPAGRLRCALSLSGSAARRPRRLVAHSDPRPARRAPPATCSIRRRLCRGSTTGADASFEVARCGSKCRALPGPNAPGRRRAKDALTYGEIGGGRSVLSRRSSGVSTPSSAQPVR